ncbi:hypothetical protein BDZ94DRAFT_1165728, partial [Collybia nuda]
CVSARDELKSVWIDTCCTSKENSVELLGVINLMFPWYKNARVCYAFRCDVPSGEDPSLSYSSFAPNQWSTRDWTL